MKSDSPAAPRQPGSGSAFPALPETLTAAATRIEFDAGERLFRIGAKPAAMFCVLAGEVRLTRTSSTGGEVILQRTRHGFLAEASMEASRYHCDAVAAEPATVWRFPLVTFRRSLEEDATFRAGWVAHLSRELRRARAQCERLTLRSAAARVLHFIESEGRNGVVTLTQSRKAWAAELGLSHEALYRTLAALETAGTISVQGKTICQSRRSGRPP